MKVCHLICNFAVNTTTHYTKNNNIILLRFRNKCKSAPTWILSCTNQKHIMIRVRCIPSCHPHPCDPEQNEEAVNRKWNDGSELGLTLLVPSKKNKKQNLIIAAFLMEKWLNNVAGPHTDRGFGFKKEDLNTVLMLQEARAAYIALMGSFPTAKLQRFEWEEVY